MIVERIRRPRRNEMTVQRNECGTEHGLMLVVPRNCCRRRIEARTTVVKFGAMSNLRKQNEPKADELR